MRNWVSSLSISELILSIYKAMAIRSSDLIARFTRTRTESWSVLVYVNGIATEVTL